MTTEELKQEITQRTGIPAALLTGETAEENIAQAKAFLAYKREHELQQPKSNAEQFRTWFNKQHGIEERDEACAVLADIEEKARLDAGSYPSLQDSGSKNVNLGNTRSAKKQFTDWIANQTAF